MGGLSLCAETINPSRAKFDGCGRDASVHHVCPVTRTTGEGRGGVNRRVLGLGDGAGGWERGGGGESYNI